VTDAGILMVMTCCGQLRMLNLLGVVLITGIYTYTDILEEPPFMYSSDTRVIRAYNLLLSLGLVCSCLGARGSIVV
jgi:hypothetical protein